jgi:cytochrome o ubiquinol oxidase subunit 2
MTRNIRILLFRLALFCAPLLFGACGSNFPLLDPKGPIGSTERYVIFVAIGLMCIVVIPVMILVYWFPKKYNAANPKGAYAPKWTYSGKLDLIIWSVPAAIIVVLGHISWHQTHHVDPWKPIASTAKPITIEVVSLDWKWLFIYPEQKIAAVNQLVFPVKVPLNFKVTSDTVVSSFFIPQLGSQIYCIAGRQSRLHLLAREPGEYFGQNQQFSGDGYSYMHFKSIATSQEKFEAWVQKVKQSTEKLDHSRFEELRKPTYGYPVTTFSGVEQGLFKHILNGPHTAPPGITHPSPAPTAASEEN